VENHQVGPKAGAELRNSASTWSKNSLSPLEPPEFDCQGAFFFILIKDQAMNICLNANLKVTVTLFIPFLHSK
jgi:hypothetical protein